METEPLNLASEQKEVTFDGGQLTYKIIGERVADKPVTIVLPGHGGGIASHGRLAEAIACHVDQQTIITNLAQLDKPADFSESIIDQEAKALIALLFQEGLTHVPLNFVGHSMGAMVIERAAQLAKEQGLSCFDYEKGSRTVFISPAGSNEAEKPLKLLSRVILKSYRHNRPKRPELTAHLSVSTGEPGQSSKVKDLRILRELGMKRLNYAALKKSGLKPAIIFYPDDRLFPWETIAKDPDYVQLLMENADGLMSPAGMPKRSPDSAFYPSQADHYTVNFNVEPTAGSIAEYLARSRAA